MVNSPLEPLRVVTVSGTLNTPSKTDRLLEALEAVIVAKTSVDVHRISVLSWGRNLLDALATGPDAGLAEQYALLRDADLIVVATPVYKGSYTGLLKLFFDFVGQDDLAGIPVLLTAVGGNQQHSLVIEHELRPLFGFFRAHVVPESIYAEVQELVTEPTPSSLASRIDRAVDAALAIVSRRRSS